MNVLCTPSESPEQALTAARSEAAALIGTLTVARVLVGQEREVDLSGLDGLVGRLCARALDLPPDEGRAMRAVLTSLLTEVDALSEALRRNADPPPTP